jgi:hypothetical protein
MMNLFKHETQEAMVKLISAQSDLIVLHKDAAKDRDEMIDMLKQLVNLQEQQISDLKVKLRKLREKQ